MFVAWILILSTVSFGLLSCGGDEKDAPPSPTPAGTTRSPGSADLDWETCYDDADCATLNVPLDHRSPQGVTIDISILRRKAASGGERIGVLLVNPGGPGSSAVAMARDAEYIFPREILDRFDIVGFDPRGVAESSPVDCGENFDDEYPLDYTPDNDDERHAIAADAEEFARACIRESGDLLPHINTVSTARDMELIREALGEEQITYFGWSYGTMLGAVYAELFPARVRAMVLDGALDPTVTFDEMQEHQAAALEAVLESFFDDCAERRSCDFHSHGDPRKEYDDVMARIDRRPMPAPDWEDGTTVVPDDAARAVQKALFDRGHWPQLAFALVRAAQDNDGSVLLDLAYPASESDEGDDTNYGEANVAVTCGDFPTDEGIEHFHELSERFRDTWPRIGASTAYWSATCAWWPQPLEELPRDIDAEGAGPILVIGSRLDPATPYRWAEGLASHLKPGRLLTFEGYAHTAAYGFASDCVDEIVLRLLVELDEPRDGAVCTYPD